MNLSTNKVIESAHVKVDEFAEKTKEERKREPEDYRKFFFIEPDTIPVTSVNHESTTPESSVTELQEVQIEMHDPELHSDATEKVSTESERPELVSIEIEQSELKLKCKRITMQFIQKGKSLY